MHGDFTRLTFRPRNHYSGVRLQQGRVHVDAEWNEQVDITSHREDVTAADVLGPCAAPTGASGFAIGLGPLLRDLRAIDLADATTGFSVGDGPTILGAADGGATWTRRPVPEGSGPVLRAVGASSAAAAVAVGDGASIASTQDGGASWDLVTPPAGVAADLRGIAFGSGTAGYAVGDVATILGTADGGATWARQAAPAEVAANLRAVAAPAADRAYAVGDDATIVATDNGGSTWTKREAPSGMDATLRAVHFADADTGFAVGDDATILATTDGGATWVLQTAPAGVAGSLRAVHFADADTGFAVGDDATILATTDGGATWTQQAAPPGVTATLRAVSFATPTAGAAVGDDGTALVTGDGGAMWTVATTPVDLGIGPGRMYVDGILCENEDAVPVDGQPDPPGQALPDPGDSGEDGNTYLFYLDVWERHLSAVEEPDIREVALGGPDTATRTKTVWQVRWEDATGLACGDFGPDWAPAAGIGTGRLAARATPAPAAVDECLVPPGGGYRRLENQLYRVEIHEVNGGGPLFKWSRDNGSLAAALESVDQANGTITISGIEKDGVAGFAGAAFAEVTDEARVVAGVAGDFVALDSVDGPLLTMASGSTLSALGAGPIVRRWEGGLVPAAPGEWIELEDGVEVRFASGEYRVGDYWAVPARTFTADVEWPQAESAPEFRPPDGVEHHWCPLALMTVSGGQWQTAGDCRPTFPPLTGLAGLYMAGGDGQESLPGESLPQLLAVWTPLEAARVRFTAGSGVVAATQGDLAGSTASAIEVTVGAGHTASCAWMLDPGGQPSQVLEATLVDGAGNALGVPVTFSANLSIAAQVGYDPAACDALGGVTTVQDAIDRLCEVRGTEPGFHVMDVVLPSTGDELLNDTLVRVADLGRGIVVKLDEAVDAASLSGKRTARVTIDLPYPVTGTDMEFWGGPPVVAYQPLVLEADAGHFEGDDNVIQWLPGEDVIAWLDRVFTMMEEFKRGDRVLARFTLDGNFIWSLKDPQVFLDGDSFGAPADGRTDLLRREDDGALSGDGIRGGQFAMWFWLVREKRGGLKSVTVSPPSIRGGQPGKGSLNLSPPFGADAVAFLRSDRTDVLEVPEQVVVPAGRSRVTFTVETSPQPPGFDVVATITARIEDQVVTQTVTVEAGAG